jgi:hypothetical protein
MTRLIKRYLARRKLAQLVKRNRESFEVRDFWKRHNAAKLGIARRAG